MTTIEDLKLLREAAKLGVIGVGDIAVGCPCAGDVACDECLYMAKAVNALPALLRCIEAADKLANLYHPADFADLAEAYLRARAALKECFYCGSPADGGQAHDTHRPGATGKPVSVCMECAGK